MSPRHLTDIKFAKLGLDGYDFFVIVTPIWQAHFSVPVNLLAWVSTLGGDKATGEVRFTGAVYWSLRAKEDKRKAKSNTLVKSSIPAGFLEAVEAKQNEAIFSPQQSSGHDLDYSVGVHDPSAEEQAQATAVFRERDRQIKGLSAFVDAHRTGAGGEAHENEFARRLKELAKLAPSSSRSGVSSSADVYSHGPATSQPQRDRRKINRLNKAAEEAILVEKRNATKEKKRKEKTQLLALYGHSRKVLQGLADHSEGTLLEAKGQVTVKVASSVLHCLGIDSFDTTSRATVIADLAKALEQHDLPPAPAPTPTPTPTPAPTSTPTPTPAPAPAPMPAPEHEPEPGPTPPADYELDGVEMTKMTGYGAKGYDTISDAELAARQERVRRSKDAGPSGGRGKRKRTSKPQYAANVPCTPTKRGRKM